MTQHSDGYMVKPLDNNYAIFTIYGALLIENIPTKKLANETCRRLNEEYHHRKITESNYRQLEKGCIEYVEELHNKINKLEDSLLPFNNLARDYNMKLKDIPQAFEELIDEVKCE